MDNKMEQNGVNVQNTPNGAQFDAANTGATGPMAPEVSNATVEPLEAKSANVDKKNRWMLPVLIVCLVLALGGVGIGIWAVLDGNARVDSLNAQVDSLRSENAELTEQIERITPITNETEDSSDMPGGSEPKYWAAAEVVDGALHVLDGDGNVVAQSDIGEVTVNEIINCEAAVEDIVLTCTVSTPEGEVVFSYDAYSNSLKSSL